MAVLLSLVKFQMPGPQIWLPIFFLAGAGLWLLNRLRRPELSAAYVELDRVGALADQELARLASVLEQFSSLKQGQFQSAANLSGVSRRQWELIKDQVSALRLMSVDIQRLLEQCDVWLNPAGSLAMAANMVSPSRYRACRKLLGETALSLPAFPGDPDPAVREASIPEFLNHFQRRIRIAESSLRSCQQPIAGQQDSVLEIKAVLADIERLAVEINQEEPARGLKLPQLRDQQLPRLRRETKAFLAGLETDPVGTLTAVRPGLRLKLMEACRMVGVIRDLQSRLWPQIQLARQALEQQSCSTHWIDRRLRELGAEAEHRIELTIATTDGAAMAESFEADVFAFVARVERVSILAEELKTVAQSSIDSTSDEISVARAKIAGMTGCAESQALREGDYQPDDELQRARQQLSAARVKIGEGDVAGASAAMNAIEVELHQIRDLLSSSLTAAQEYSLLVSQMTIGLDRIRKSIDDLHIAMADLLQRFDADVLATAKGPFACGIEDGPNAEPVSRLDGLHQLVDRWHQQATDSLQSSQRMVQFGKVLIACNQIELLTLDLEDLEPLLLSMQDHIAWVSQLPAANAERFRSIQNQVEQWGEYSADRLHSTESDQAKQKLLMALEAWQANPVPSVRPNPVEEWNQLERLGELAESVAIAARRENGRYSEAMAAMEGARAEAVVAHQLIMKSQNDSIPDSPQTRSDQMMVAEWESKLERLVATMGRDVTNWETFAAEATEINIQLCQLNGRLRKELRAAEAAARDLQQASATVRDAHRWRGQLQVNVSGNPGGAALNRARQALARGEYQVAIFESKQAIQSAHQAIQAAEAEVSHRRRQLARVAEMQRQRQARLRLFDNH